MTNHDAMKNHETLDSSNVYTDPVSGISFRATPEGWEWRSAVWLADKWDLLADGDFSLIDAALRLFGPPLPSKPRTVTLLNGRTYTHDGEGWRNERGFHASRLGTGYAPGMLDTIDRLQNGSDGPVSEGDDR